MAGSETGGETVSCLRYPFEPSSATTPHFDGHGVAVVLTNSGLEGILRLHSLPGRKDKQWRQASDLTNANETTKRNANTNSHPFKPQVSSVTHKTLLL